MVERWPVSSQSRDKTQVLPSRIVRDGEKPTRQVQKKNQFSWWTGEDRSDQRSFILPAPSWEACRADEAAPEQPQLNTTASVRVGPDPKTASLLLTVKTGSSNLQLAPYWLSCLMSLEPSSFVVLCLLVPTGITDLWPAPLTRISILWLANAFAYMIYSLSDWPLFLSFPPVLSLLSPSTQTPISRTLDRVSVDICKYSSFPPLFRNRLSETSEDFHCTDRLSTALYVLQPQRRSRR